VLQARILGAQSFVRVVWLRVHWMRQAWARAAQVIFQPRKSAYTQQAALLCAGGCMCVVMMECMARDAAAALLVWCGGVQVATRLRREAERATVPTVLFIVTHGNFMSLLVQELLGLPAPFDEGLLRHDNTALTALNLAGTVAPLRRCQLVQLNRSEHLDDVPALMRTRQGISLTGFSNGRRPRGWQPPPNDSRGSIGSDGGGLAELGGCDRLPLAVAILALISWLQRARS
jgi:hypothetical protein